MVPAQRQYGASPLLGRAGGEYLYNAFLAEIILQVADGEEVRFLDVYARLNERVGNGHSAVADLLGIQAAEIERPLMVAVGQQAIEVFEHHRDAAADGKGVAQLLAAEEQAQQPHLE